MSLSAILQQRPPRVSFTDLRTTETVEMPFVPSRFTEELVANWARKTVVGMSHQRKHFVSTSNYKIPGIEFFFSAITPKQAEEVHNGRRFLMSLMYPTRGAEGIAGAGPARILFIWPQMVSFTCTLDRLSITHEQFNREGLAVVFRAQMDLEEIRDARLASEDVRRQGTQRSSGEQTR